MPHNSLHSPHLGSNPPEPPYSRTTPTPPDTSSGGTTRLSSGKLKTGVVFFCLVVAGLYVYGMHMEMEQVKSTSGRTSDTAVTVTVDNATVNN